MRKKLVALIIIGFSIHAYGNKNLSGEIDYVKNAGQWESPVLYKADLFGGHVYLEKNALTFKFIEKSAQHHLVNSNKTVGTKKTNTNDNIFSDKIMKGHVYKIKWLNSNPEPTIESTEKQSYYNNYFIGNNHNKWKKNVGNYRTVHYLNIYPHIDFKIYSEATTMKSDYIIHKNGKVQDLQFKYDGVDAISVEEDGKLKITTSINSVYELKPYAYQFINGKTTEVACKYVLNGNILSFRLNSNYNKDFDLIIDPTLIFSTYSGSSSDNWGSSATHDNAGNMFLGGIALGDEYPTTTGAFQTVFGGGDNFEPTDIVITKFNASGTAKLYSTYLGGSSNELLSSLLCTPENELIIVSSTSSANFPITANAFDTSFNGGNADFAIGSSIGYPNGADIAVTKLNEDGTQLTGSTYFGGSGNDGLNLSNNTLYNYGDDTRSDVAIDNYGNIYITSTTSSSNIPGTTGKAQPSSGGGIFDGIVAKFNSNLSSLNWSTYYGGSGADASYSISLDNNNSIFICGGTASSYLPGIENGLNKIYLGGETDGFVAKLSNDGNNFLASTYLGTNNYDQAFILDMDKENNVYIFGQTLGDYPVTNNVYANNGAKQFIHKLNNALNSTVFGTVFGTVNSTEINISPTAFLVDICGNIYAAGWGGNVNNHGSTNNMTVTNDAFKSNTDGSDFYLINLNANAVSLKYATYFGEDGGIGDHVDGGTSRFDKNGIVYEAVCASCGGTNSFPVTDGVIGPNNNSFNCNMAGFKFKFDLSGLQIITATATPDCGLPPLSVNFTYTSTQPGTQFYWDFGDGTNSTAQFPNHIYNSSGIYTVRFILRDSTNCNPVDSTTIAVNISKPTTIDSIICQGQSVTIANQTFTTSGSYNISVQNNTGCDSFFTLNLIVNPVIDTIINRAICRGQTINIGNQIFSTSGNYAVSLTTAKGCDSIIHLNLLVTDTIIENIIRFICTGDSLTAGNQIFYTAGNYTIPLRSAAGCDSILNLSLSVLDTVKANIIKTICDGDSVIVGTEVFKLEGNYTISLQSSPGCDSLVNLSLAIIPTKSSAVNDTICQGKSVTIGNLTFSEAGNYIVKLVAVNGCDSIIKLHLIVNPLPDIDAKSDKDIVFPNEQIQLDVITNQDLSFNWAPAALVNDVTLRNPTAFITSRSWFIVTATNISTQCISTDSVLVNIQYEACTKENIYLPNAFTPNSDGFNDVFIPRSIILKSMKLVVHDRWGNNVFESNDINSGWDGNYKGQPAQADAYGYYFIGECNQGEKITLKGNVTLLR